MQNKAVRIMCFKTKYDAVNSAYKKLKIIKLRDILTFNNCQFVHVQINRKLPVSFNEYFERTSQHNYNTIGSKEGKVMILARKTTAYGKNSVIHREWSDWNGLWKHSPRI